MTRSRFTGGQVRYVVFVLVVVSAGAVAGMWAAGFGGTSHTTHVDPWPRVDQSMQVSRTVDGTPMVEWPADPDR